MAGISQIPEMSESMRKMVEEAFGKPSASDNVTMLYDQIDPWAVNKVQALHKEQEHPQRITEVKLYEPGEIHTMSDGRQYQVDDDGKWIRINSK